ncbi:MAG: Cas10/Cmr2 second palm domain-containing protein [Bryobacteraceae bacterium]
MQIFLEGKLFGIDDCLLAPAAKDPDRVFTGRSHWISLLSEVLPRALLTELSLAKILLGSSGGGQFLLVLPDEFRGPAETFLEAAARDIAALSRDTLKLVWSITENLGDWSDVRKRLQEDLNGRRGTPRFEPVVPALDSATEEYFAEGLGFTLRDAELIGWSPETPGRVLRNGGKHTWQLTDSQEAIPFARHAAPSDDLREPASTAVLANRADGLQTWGVLRGDVDNFAIRIHRAQSIEEHIQLSVMYKQFFAGELEVLCSMAEFWRKVTVIYSGGDDFAVYGAWDALIGLAGEMQRVFSRFAERNLKDFTGPEGKTISMALALAPAADASLGAVFEEAGQRLEAAKSADKDCIWLLGRTLEWKQFAESGTLKDSLARMVSDFGCSPQYLRDLCGIYRETQAKMSKRQARRSGGERPWRYHRRIRRILNASRAPGPERNDFQKARAALIADLIGRSAVTVKLRPAGRVALEWARLAAE